MKPEPLKILIADDHALLRRGLMQLLSDELPHVMFGEAENSQQALDLIWNQSWSLVVLDINMPGRNGFEVLEEVTRKKPAMPVLVLSAFPEDQLGLRALQAGAAGYVTKQSANESLVEAIKKVMAGGRFISPTLAEAMADHLRRPADGELHNALSSREFQVMQMLVTGRTIKEIALELSLSAKTVSTFRRRLLKKLRLEGNADLVRYALLHRLTD